MKKTALILDLTKAFVLVFFLVMVISSCKNDGTTPTASTASTSETVADGPAAIAGIAYVQMDSVINNYDMYHDKRTEFEKKAKDMEAELSAKVRSFQKEAADFQTKYEKGLMTRSEAEEMQQKLQRRQQDLEETSGKMRQDLAEQEGVMGRQIQDALTAYIAKYNADKKYSLILSNATILYGTPAMNITQEVLKGMNEDYIASKAKK